MLLSVRAWSVSVAMLLVAAPVAGARAEASASASLGAWQDYALSAITPDFTWADKQASAPTVLDNALASESSSSVHLQLSGTDQPLQFGLDIGTAAVGDLPGQSAHGTHSALNFGGGLERSFFSPSVTRALGDDTSVTAAAVFVYQQFASWGLGEGVATQQMLVPAPSFGYGREASVGSGVRLELNRQLRDSVGFSAAYQSRVNMDTFQTYHGVFSDPGDFDLPAVAAMGLSWYAMPDVRFTAGLTRVMWSDITAFTSRALPRRLLRLLGDGTSPNFGWQDLTVVSADIGWLLSTQDQLALTVTSHQQPNPTAAVLRDALNTSNSETDVGVRYTHDFQRFGRVNLGASYAPVEYFLGNASSNDRGDGGNQFEIEAVWSMSF